jgi:sarcosine oxidase
MPQYDVIVVGLGITGVAALAELARRGVRAIGIERHAVGHDLGSSHGETRMIRLGYFEHPSYVPLLRRTYELWRGLEAATSTRLLHVTGIAEMGAPDSDIVAGTLAASRMHGLPHEVLTAAEAMRRFPAFRLPDDFVCVVQPDGGFVAAETAIATLAAQARTHGAEILTHAEVQSVKSANGGVRVSTSRGDIDAKAVIAAAGPWMKQLVRGLPLRVTRQVMTWFEAPEPARFAEGKFPVFLLASRHGNHYGFPSLDGRTVKIAKHHHFDQTVDPDRVERTVTPADEAAVRAALTEFIPAADGPLAAAKTCLYTVTPDHDFIIDRLPDAPNIVAVSACSGHGFKFAPVLGEVLADLATKGETSHDIGRFTLSRYA